MLAGLLLHVLKVSLFAQALFYYTDPSQQLLHVSSTAAPHSVESLCR
jgi:hypothetical protein